MSPRVSVITPTYNHEAYIGACIESVLAQSFSDWEMVVVDDGSTDRTVEVVEGFGDPRVKLIRQDNKGVRRLAETYNTALAASSGELIAILEGDDYWPAEKLALQVPDFDAAEVVLSWGRAQIVEDGKETGLIPNELPPEAAQFNRPLGEATWTMLQPQWLTFAWPATVVMRRSALDAIGGFRQAPYLIYVDLPTFLRLGLEGEWRYHDEICGFWRRHGASTTSAESPAIFNGAYRLAYDFACEMGDRLSAQRRSELTRRWASFQYERCALIGRIVAGGGHFKEAVQWFEKARSYPIPAKSKALTNAAIALSRLGRSPELPYWMAGKPLLDVQLSKDRDPLVTADSNVEAFEFFEF